MKFCPCCGNDISAYLAAEGRSVVATEPVVPISPANYDQTNVWRELVGKAEKIQATPPQSSQLGMQAAQEVAAALKGTANGESVETIVHLVFDRPIVPSGGVLSTAVTGLGGGELQLDRMKAMGYAIEDGKVATSNNSPIGPVYQIIDYWGGEKQHRRWHLAKPVELDASKHGDPLFMDQNMVAFGAVWNDSAKSEEAFLSLMNLFTDGVNGDGIIAHPLEVKIAIRNRA